MSTPQLKLREIAERIRVHLKRFENDPKINKTHEVTSTTDYYHTSACASGRYVMITYVAYQGARSLTRDDALKYLVWLDAGNIGRHYRALCGAP